MDQSMICLPSDVKTALEKTNFIKRYEMLSNTFNGERTPLNERLRYIDGEIVLDSLAQLGYKAHFESKEKYFIFCCYTAKSRCIFQLNSVL